MSGETSGPFLAEPLKRLLTALLDTLIPASPDGKMPSAAEVGFESYLHTQAHEYISALEDVLQSFDSNFSDLPPNRRHELLVHFSKDRPAEFSSLLARVYDCYYQDNRVRGEISVVQGAPFPQGNDVTQGDLSLLDPVIENRDRYRYRSP